MAGSFQLPDLLYQGFPFGTVPDTCQLLLATGLLGGNLIFKYMGL
jgi:hypothetical protein